MIDIAEVQCSINRAVSSVLGVNGGQNDLESLKSVCLALESLEIRKNANEYPGYEERGGNFDCNGNYDQFLNNIRRLLGLFCSRVATIRKLDVELAEGYTRTFTVMVNILKSGYSGLEYGSMSAAVIKIWCDVLCIRGSNRIDGEHLKKNEKLLKDYVPLVLEAYKGLENNKEWKKILFVVLEVLKATEDDQVVKEILEALENVPGKEEMLEVYPGVVSTLVNKMKDLKIDTFRRGVNALLVWIRKYLDRISEEELGKEEWICVRNEKDKENKKDEILKRTEEAIKIVIKKYKKNQQRNVCWLCTSLTEYEFLEDELKEMMGRLILESILSEEMHEEFKNNVYKLPVSFKLILRDLVTRSINEEEERSEEYFKGYLKIKEDLGVEIDHYMVLKFLINRGEVDLEGVERKLVVNRKYLVDSEGTFPEELPGKELGVEKEEKETMSKTYFKGLSNELRWESLTNLLSLYRSKKEGVMVVRIVEMIKELVEIIGESEEGNEVNKELIWEVKSAIVSKKMFTDIEKEENGEEVVVVVDGERGGEEQLLRQDELIKNGIKIKIIEVLTELVKRSKKEDLDHRDMELMLFKVIPEYNSDYVKIWEKSKEFMEELSRYYSKYVKKEKKIKENDEVNGNKDNELNHINENEVKSNELKRNELKEKGYEFREMLEYYTNSLVKRIICSIGARGVSDVVYTIMNFENKSVDLKVVFDLTVQFSKYFDRFTISEGVKSEGEPESFDEKMLNVLFSFNYILIYVKEYLKEKKGIEDNNNNNNNSNNNNNNINSNNNDNINNNNNNNNINSQECKLEYEMKGCETQDKEKKEREKEAGKGDFELSVVTLIITRVRYYTEHKNPKVKYLALLALYRGLIIASKNEYIFRIRVHEVWDCITHSLEVNLKNFRIVSVILEILQLIVVKTYYFIENRLMSVFELLEQVIMRDEQPVGVAEERNGTIRYKGYREIVNFTLEISKRVVNRSLFAELMIIAIKLHSPKTCESIREKLNEIFINLSKKNPTLIRNVLLEINKGKAMNTSFIKFAFKREVKSVFKGTPPHQVMPELPIVHQI